MKNSKRSNMLSRLYSVGLVAIYCIGCDSGGNPSEDTSMDSENTTGSEATDSDNSMSSGDDSDSSMSSGEDPMEKVWEPAPCPEGWVRPAAAVLDPRVLRIDGVDFSEEDGLDIYRNYPNAHAFGTCMRVENGQIAQVSVEFGPEVQGYPQSWIQVGIDSGEGSYRMGEKDDPEFRPYSLIYTHAQENPGSSMPTLTSWSASNDDGMQWHELGARWVSSVPGHHLQLSNKTIVVGKEGERKSLDLAFNLDFTLPGGPTTPNQEFCSTVGSQDRCDALDCGKSTRVRSVDEPLTCVESASSVCVLDTTVVDILEGEARTYYDPTATHRYVAVRGNEWDFEPIEIPTGWLACDASDTTKPSCDCSCSGAACRAERMRDAMEACDRPRPCDDVTQGWLGEEGWTDAQRCLFESMRDRVVGSYRLAVDLGDPDYDIRIHMREDGRIDYTLGGCNHGSIPGCAELRHWIYPMSCLPGEADFFSQCLENPQGACLSDLWEQRELGAWFQECTRNANVSCE